MSCVRFLEGRATCYVASVRLRVNKSLNYIVVSAARAHFMRARACNWKRGRPTRLPVFCGLQPVLCT